MTFQYDSTSGDLVSITSPGLGTEADLVVMRFFYKATDINLNQSGMFSGVTPVFPPNNTAHVLEYVYLSSSSDGNVTGVTTYTDAATPSGAITHATKYDIAGNVTSAQVDCCQTKTIDYSSTYKFAYPTSMTSGDPNGLHVTISASYDFHTGLPATSTDENGQVTTNYYNADSLRLNHIENPSGGGSTYFYYGDGLVSDAASHYHSWVNVSTQLSSSDWVDVYRFYTGRGEVAQAFGDGTGSGPWSSQVTRYDAMGRVGLTTNPFATGGYGGGLHVDVSGGDPVTVPSYDHLGRVTSVSMPSGDTANPTTVQATAGYDGVFTTVTDQAGKVRRQKVDEFGRVIRLDEPSSAGLGTTASPNQHRTTTMCWVTWLRLHRRRRAAISSMTRSRG